MSLNPAEKLECDGHFLSVPGHVLAVNGQKTLANVTENSHGAVRARTKQGAQSGRKQSKGTISDSGVTHGQNRGLEMTEDSQNTLPVIRQKRGVPIYMTNPSVPAKDEISRARRTQFGNEHRGLVIDGGTGEVLGRGGAYMYEFEEVDKERFVKLFLDGIRKTAGLSTTGLMIFELIYHQVRESPNSDEIKMSLMVAQDRLPNLAERTYRRGLRELLDKEVIFRSPVEGVFFVNIRCMFNGDRLAFVKAYHLKGSGYQPELQLESPKEGTQ